MTLLRGRPFGLSVLAGGGLVLVGLTLSATAAGADPGNLIVNGSFETPADPAGYVVYGAGSTAITGWTVGHGTVSNASVEQDGPDIWPADTGTVSLDLAGNAPGDLYQYVPTVPGATYTLQFAIGGNFYCGQKIKTMNLTWGATHLSEQFNDATSTSSNMNWQHTSIQVNATTVSTLIDFADATPDASSCGATLDSVSLIATPPAATPEAPMAGLLVVGAAGVFGGGMFISRRRTRRSSAPC